MTGRELVATSLRLLGVVASGETPAASEAVDGLSALNRMIDSWSTEELIIYATNRETPVAMTPNVSSVTVGTGGTINISRPMWINYVKIQDANTGVEYPTKMLTQEEYAALLLKSVTSQYPLYVYDDGGFPLRTLQLYPVPSSANKIVLYTMRPLSQIATLDTSVSLPPGYDDALVYNLAVRLAPEYGKLVPDAVTMNAMETKGNIKRANHRTSVLRVDEAIQASGGFNIFSGGYSR